MTKVRGWRSRLKRGVIVLSIIVPAYFISYAVLSALGGYQPDVSGRMRYLGGMGVTDCVLWQPKGVYFKRYLSIRGTTEVSADLLGYVYAPLISADRAWVHPTRFYFE